MVPELAPTSFHHFVITFHLTANEDYEQITEAVILTFAENVQFVCVNISILPDNIVESTELFTVLLSSNDTVAFNQSSAVVVIVDSDQGGYFIGIRAISRSMYCLQESGSLGIIIIFIIE